MFLSGLLKAHSTPHEFDRLVVFAGSTRHPGCHYLALRLNLFGPVSLPGCDQGIMQSLEFSGVLLRRGSLGAASRTQGTGKDSDCLSLGKAVPGQIFGMPLQSHGLVPAASFEGIA